MRHRILKDELVVTIAPLITAERKKRTRTKQKRKRMSLRITTTTEQDDNVNDEGASNHT